MTEMSDFQVAAEMADELGEGPVADLADRSLRWVDIVRGLWHRLDVESGEVTSVQLEMSLTGFAPANDGGFIGAFESGIARFDQAGKISEWLHRPESDLQDNRFNDAGTDPAGRFVAGTMNKNADSATAALYSVHRDGRLERQLDGITISNTVAFSPDGSVFYTADSALGELKAYRYDPEAGQVGALIPSFRTAADLPGLPDGSAVDVEGFLWNARWGGGCVVRLAPDGSTDRIVPLPVQQPTSCAFLGSRLFVTSARVGLEADALADAPLSGALFSVETGVEGLPRPAFGAYYGT